MPRQADIDAARGSFDYVNPNITETNFQAQTKRGTVELLTYRGTKTTDEIVTDMRSRGMEPASLDELLDLNWDGAGIVVALGKPWRDQFGDSIVACFRGDLGTRRLSCYRRDRAWITGTAGEDHRNKSFPFRFAAVRV